MEAMAADVFMLADYRLPWWILAPVMRAPGEPLPVVHHTGVLVSGTDIVEARLLVLRHNFLQTYPPSRWKRIWVARRKGLSAEQRQVIARAAMDLVGQIYGIPRLLAHGIDDIIFGHRRIIRKPTLGLHICSSLVAWAYEQAGFDFGVPSWAADPDDIWDYIMENPATRTQWDIIARY